MSKPVICIGAALIDELFHAHDEMLLGTTNLMTVKKSPGGVARNIAYHLAFLQVPVEFIGVFGNDSDGDWLKKQCTDASVGLDACITADKGTGKYTAIINKDGSLFTAIITNALEYLITPAYLSKQQELLKTAAYILADTNLSIEAISWLVEFTNEHHIPLIIETVSVPPAKKLTNINLNGVYLVTPNEDELIAMCTGTHSTEKEYVDELLERGVENIWLHKGAEGSMLFSKNDTIVLHATKIEVEDCTGAGDATLTGWLLGKHSDKDDLQCLKIAHTLAIETLQIDGAVATHLDRKQLLELATKYYSE